MRLAIIAILILFAVAILVWPTVDNVQVPSGREEVVFWHFWGGDDLLVVQDIVRSFNESQSKYWIRETSMPGNNMQAKLFLSIGGGSPPDLVNQDDAIIADWTKANLIVPLEEIATEQELDELANWMLPNARRLTEYGEHWMGICNGLDVRALYYNRSFLSRRQLAAPNSLDEFEAIVAKLSPSNQERDPNYFTFLPDSRRLWAWAIVFGGGFQEPNTHSVSVNSAANIEALAWMQSFAKRYGTDALAAFRNADQSLPGKAFPLLPTQTDSEIGRYVFVMDGQWRIRDIEKFAQSRSNKNLPAIEFGVCPLPNPAGGKANAGWLNGNFFVVPRGAKQSRGAFEFMKFWIGYENESAAAKTCAAGGWIPVSRHVIEHPRMIEYVKEHPLFQVFLDLARSPNQISYPNIPRAESIRREVNQAVFRCMNDVKLSPQEVLDSLQTRWKQVQEAGAR